LNSTEERIKELRKFGLLVGIIFLCIGLFPLTKGKAANYYLAAPGAVLCFLGWIYPLALSPVHAAWMKIGHVLGRINTFLILSLIYYVVFTPTRLLLMLFSKERKFGFRTGAASYWIKRSPEDFRETMKRQF
jgi:hypothetical protein